MFNHIDLPENNQVWKRKNIDGKRHYVLQGGEEIALPSITSVLGCRGKKSLLEWRNRVSPQEANRISRRASGLGTQFHKACENYLNNVDPFKTDGEVNMFVPMIKPRFEQFKPILNRIDNIMAQELFMAAPKLGVAGTVDCIAEFDGVMSIIDFKTSSRPKKESYIKNYFTQETAYSIMAYEMYGLKISNLVTLISVEDGEPQVFVTKPQLHFDYLKESIGMFHRGEYD